MVDDDAHHIFFKDSVAFLEQTEVIASLINHTFLKWVYLESLRFTEFDRGDKRGDFVRVLL